MTPYEKELSVWYVVGSIVVSIMVCVAAVVFPGVASIKPPAARITIHESVLNGTYKKEVYDSRNPVNYLSGDWSAQNK